MLGRKLRGPLERLVHRTPAPDQPSNNLLERHKSMMEEVKTKMKAQQTRQARYYNTRQKDTHFQPDKKCIA